MEKHRSTFDEQVSGSGGGASHELVLSSIPEVNVSDGERVRELPAADLTPVRRLDLHAILQPLVGDALVVDGDLEGDAVSLLGVQVRQHGGDQDGCTGEQRSSDILEHQKVLFWLFSEESFLNKAFNNLFYFIFYQFIFI